jgi:hypothetical protein
MREMSARRKSLIAQRDYVKMGDEWVPLQAGYED